MATASSPARPNWPASTWLTDWPFPILVDDERNAAFRAFGQGDFPYFVFIDGNGEVTLRLAGEQNPDQLAELMGSLAELG